MMENKFNKSVKTKEADGMVWITDGKVYVKNEAPNGMPPLINPCKEIQLLINGKPCSHLTAVSEKDSITIMQGATEKPLKTTIEIDDDCMKAYLNYSPPGKSSFKVLDTVPANKADIRVEESFLEAVAVSKEELLKSIEESNIKYGILSDVLQDIINKNYPGRYLIAEGKPPVPSKDERLECFFDEDSEKDITLNEDDHGRVDFRNIFNYSIVKNGEAIARVHPALPGENGIDVYGNPVLPKEPSKITILPNNFTFYDENSKTIYAKKPGRPSKIVKNNSILFNIIDKIILDEVSIKTGNIKFSGDIEVVHDVHESLDVISKQNITVNGNVNFANIMSGNNINIKKSVISSRIYAGTGNIFGKNPVPEFKRISDELSNLIKSISDFPENLSNELNIRSVSEKFYYLLNSKHKSVTEIIYNVLNNFKKEKYDIDNEEKLLLIKRTRLLLGNTDEIISLDFLNEILDSINILCAAKEEAESKGNVEAEFLLSTEIHATGNVKVSGKGCINSKIYARGNVSISGIFRGGEITSGNDVEIMTLGSEVGVKTLVAVPSHGTITVNTVYPDSVIKIGEVYHKFLQEKRIVKAKLKDGIITF
ncbi:MAG: FapA family protein [Bacillota bacterium]|nr:FapA family protein [Bacillota bacterium]